MLNTFQKRDTKFMLIESNKPVKFYWRLSAYLSTKNKNNFNRMVSTTELESTWAVILEQLFALGSLIIVE